MHDSALGGPISNRSSLKESSVDTIKQRQNMNLKNIGRRASGGYALPLAVISNNLHLLKNQHYFNVKNKGENGRNFTKEGTSTGIQVHQYDAMPTNRRNE